MSFPYPAKPWQDGQELNVAMGGGYYLLGRYNESKNLWSFRRIRDDQVNREQIFTFDVLTTLAQPSPRDKSPFDLTDPTNLQTQQDVNWFLWNYIRDLELEGAKLGFTAEVTLLEADPNIDETFERDPNDYATYGQAISYLNGPNHEVTTRIVVPKKDREGFDWSSILRAYKKGDLLLTIQTDDMGTIDDTTDDIDYRSDWELIEDPVENLHSFSCAVQHVGEYPPHLPAFGEPCYIRLIVNPTSDLYVRKTGDTMTGALVMDDAGEIEMIDTALEMRRTMQNDGSDTWDSNLDRFGTIRPRAPKIINDDGTEIIDNTDNFGINFDLSDRNTYRNTLKVSAKENEILRIQSGGQPNVVFNNTIDRSGLVDNNGIEAGVVIKGIPTPDRELTPGDFAVNKEYVDKEDALLLNGIIDLQEEIDAIAPSLEKGAWEWDPNTDPAIAPADGSFFLLKNDGTITNQYNEADAVAFNKTDAGGTEHSNWDTILGDPANPDTNKLILLFDKPDPDKCLGKITNIQDIGEAGNPYADTAIVEFNRTEGFGQPDNNQDDNGKYITFVNIFQEPSGGTASDFVLKKGDQMTGELEFYHEQPGSNINYNPPTSGTKDLKFSTKRLDTDAVQDVYFYQPGRGNYLVSSGSLMARNSLYTSSYIYGTTFNADGTRTTKNPKILFNRETDGSGNVTNEYGALRWSSSNHVEWNSSGGKLISGSSPRLEWNSNRVDILKPVNNTTTRDGFLVRGATTSSNNYTSNTIGSQAGSLLVVKHVSNQPDHIEYRGKITESTDIVNKAYVDNNVNGNVINGNWNGNNSSKITITKSSGVYYISGG